MDANERPKARLFRVGKRVYRKTCKGDRRRRPTYTYPEVRLSNGWLRDAGFRPGDRVAVQLIEPGLLALVLVKKAQATEACRTAGSHQPARAPGTSKLPVDVRM